MDVVSEVLEPFIPKPEQADAITELVGSLWETGGALNGSALGTGKTLMAVETMLRLGAQTVLISAPLHTRHNWESTALRQSHGAIPFRWINNTTKSGKAALEALKFGEAGFYFIGRELFRLTDWRGLRLDGLIHDEIHSASNRKSKGYQAAFDLRSRTRYTIAQSATWYGSQWENAWSVGRILWPDVVERNYYRWVLQYCRQTYDPHATKTKKKVTGERNPGEFARSLPCYVNLESRAGDPPLVADIDVDLSARQRKLYDEFEQRGIVWLEDHPMIAEVPIVQRVRLRQLTLAECTVNDDGEVSFLPNAKSSKFDALKEMLADWEGEKVLIVTDSAKFARMVAARLDSAFAWTGDKTGKEREKAKGQFTLGSLQYIVATQAAIAEGIDGFQHVCHIMVELSASDSPVLNEQVLGRLDRTGQTKRVFLYRLHGTGTLDQGQSATLLGREMQMRASMLKEREKEVA